MNASGVVLALASDLRKYLLGGVNPTGSASLVGDVGQMQKALVARILQSTSPGLTRNLAGSLGEQQQALIDYLFGGVQHSSTASSTGDLEQKINYLMTLQGMKRSGGTGPFVLPTLPGTPGGTSVTPGTTAWGSWVEVSASAPSNLYVLAATVKPTVLSTTAAAGYGVGIGTGAAASEVQRAEVSWPGYGLDAGGALVVPGIVPLLFPIYVASGTRIAVRGSAEINTRTFYATLLCVAAADLAAL